MTEKRSATPSSAACRMSRGVVSNVSPVIAPFASGSQPGRALAAEEREEREPVVVGLALSEPGLARESRPATPEVAAVGERAPFDDAPLVDAVEEEPRLRLRTVGLVEDAQRRPRCRPSAPRACVRCSRRPRFEQAPSNQSRDIVGQTPAAVAGRRPSSLEQLVVPPSGVQGRAARYRTRSTGSSAARRRRAGHGGSPGTRRSGRRRERHRARSPRARRASPARTTDGDRRCARGRPRDRAAAKPLRRVGASRVPPAEQLGQGLPVPAEGEKAVPEARDAHRSCTVVAAVDHLPDERDDLVGITALVRLLLQLVSRIGAFVEALCAYRGGSDIEGEDFGHLGN